MPKIQENVVLRILRIPEVSVVFFSFLLHLAWEVFQSPFFRWKIDSTTQFIWCKYACTSADVLITLGAFWLTALIFKNRHWYILPVRVPKLVFLVIGLIALAFSEYRNVYFTHVWTYVETMPVIFGIGLLPFLQWIVLPLLLIALLQKVAKQ